MEGENTDPNTDIEWINTPPAPNNSQMGEEGTERTSRQKSQILSRMGEIGGQVKGVAGKLGGQAAQGIKGLAGKAAAGVRSGVSSAGAAVQTYQEKREVLSGLKEDYSTRGNHKRYWLDSSHYIVFDPNDVAERDMAQQAIEDFRNFGSVEGTQGDLNEVIEAGETELSTRKSEKDPLVSPQMSRNLAEGGKYLASGSLFPKDSDGDEDEDGLDLDPDEDEVVRPRTRQSKSRSGNNPTFEVPTLRSMGLEGSATYKDSEMFGEGRIPKVRTPGSDRELIGNDRGKIAGVPRAQTDRELFGGVPHLQGDSMRNQETSAWGPPGTYTIPRMDDILPRIGSNAPRQAVPQPVQRAQPQSVQPRGPITYKVPRLDDIMPRIDMGMGGQRPQPPSVPAASEVKVRPVKKKPKSKPEPAPKPAKAKKESADTTRKARSAKRTASKPPKKPEEPVKKAKKEVKKLVRKKPAKKPVVKKTKKSRK